MAITDSTRNMIEKLVDRVNKLIDKAESLSAGLEALDDKVNNLPPSTIVRTGLIEIASGSAYTTVPSEWTTDIQTGSLCNLSLQIKNSSGINFGQATMNYIWNTMISGNRILQLRFTPSWETYNSVNIILGAATTDALGYILFQEPNIFALQIAGRTINTSGGAIINRTIQLRWYLTIIPPA